jgi:beta-1,4-N-acetylglucosaminyltransferase
MISSLMRKRLFVTVGSTKFPQLIRAVLSPEAIEVLLDLGFRELCVQYGTDTELFKQSQGQSELSITGFDYSQSIEREMQQADLIISHAGSNTHQLCNILGSGSVLEALHLGKLLIVVPNTSLMDNHQAEVAKALSDEGFLLETSPRYTQLLSVLTVQ